LASEASKEEAVLTFLRWLAGSALSLRLGSVESVCFCFDVIFYLVLCCVLY
jgi:hypothetical protein